MPHLILIAGPNGAGKTTLAPTLLKDTIHINNFINADTIAQGLCAFQPEHVAIQAGRIMLKRIRELAKEKVDFAFETTLSSKTFARWIPELQKQGYQFSLIFLWLAQEELAVLRVRERVRLKGHAVPEDTIRRRYKAGLNNFFTLYRPLTDSWQFFDNSCINQPTLIVQGCREQVSHVNNEKLWKQIVETYYDKKIN